jgi:HEAT repeat protein
MTHTQSSRALFVGSLNALNVAILLCSAWLLWPMIYDHCWVRPLVRAIRDSDDMMKVWWEIGPLVEEIGEPAIPSLMELLTDSTEETRSRASSILETIAGKSNAVVPALIFAMNHADGDVRADVCQTLMDIAEPGSKVITAIPALVEALKDDYDLVRLRAAETLGHLGPDAISSLPSLFESLRDPSALVRVRAAVAIWRIDHQISLRTVQVLLTLLNDNSEDEEMVRYEAAELLWTIDPNAAAKAGLPAPKLSL